MKIPLIAIVGRPNVGKSALFNRIIKRHSAIVEPAWGTTRDRIYAEFSWGGKHFEIVDTGGLVLDAKVPHAGIKSAVRAQTERAVEEADILLFVCEATSGITAIDSDMAGFLRESGKAIYVIANKADNEKLQSAAVEFFNLGLGKPYAVSALSGRGIDELLDDIASKIEAIEKQPLITTAKLAIIGRPNVGKSSFINAILKEERVIVDDAPGTTRDAIDTYLHRGEERFVLIDTAGIRKLKKIKERVDIYSLSRTRQAIERSDCCLILIDAAIGMTQDDVSIIGRVVKEGKGILLVANKWDLVKGVSEKEYERSIKSRLSFSTYIPVIFTSSKTKENVDKTLILAKQIVENSLRKITTHELCKTLESSQKAHPHPYVGGKRVRLYYVTQTKSKPVELLIFTNHPKLVSQDYSRFLEGRIRQLADFTGVPIAINYRLSGDGEKTGSRRKG
ncbi:MAG: ribosome biogenesis GTPase Der [Candidatus Omnitrophota bacterium]